jgi:PadR family transcriptional regulator PadR
MERIGFLFLKKLDFFHQNDSCQASNLLLKFDSWNNYDNRNKTKIIGGKTMDLNNTKAQMRKGVLEYCILLVIDGKPLYASDIIDKLSRSKMIVVEGTLYPLLTRLKNDGLLAYKWEESTQGPPRKYYELTDDGRYFLNEMGSSWDELVDAVRMIKEQK